MDTEIYKHALNQVSIIAVTDEKGIITYANENFCRLAQYSAAELIGQTHRIINSGYHNPSFFNDLWRTISRGETWQGEIKNRAKDGSFYWVDTAIYPLKNETGQITGYFSSRIDITDKKQSQEKNREADQILRAVMHSTKDTFLLIKSDFTIISFNQSAAQSIYKLHNRHLQVGDSVLPYINAENLDRFTTHFKKALTGETIHSETLIDFHGEQSWLQFTYLPVYAEDATFIGISLTSTNITARKNYEAEFLKSNERYQLISKASNDAIYDYDIANNNIEWYDTFYELFEYDPNEVLATLEWWEQQVHPDDKQRISQSLETAMSRRQKIWQEEYRFRCRAGNYKHVFERGYIQYTPEGTPFRMIGSLQNIQRLKEHEQQIIAQNESLRAIAYSQSHIVRKPVANILGLVASIKKEELSPENLQLIKYLEQVALELDTVIRGNVSQINETYQLPTLHNPPSTKA